LDTTATVETLVLLASTYFSQGRFKSAAGYFRRLTELFPEDFQHLNNLGVTLEAQGDFAGALYTYRKAIALAPRYQKAHYHLGNLLQRMGELAEAKIVYQHALTLDDKNVSILINLAIIYLHQDEAHAAVILLKKATHYSPQHFDGWLNLGYAYYILFELENAHRSYARAQKLSPRSPLIFNNIGLLLQAKGEYTEARDAFQHALTLNPDFIEAKHNLGLLALGQFQFEEGWRGYHARPTRRYTSLPLPQYKNTAIYQGYPLFIHSEQGLGDEFFFMRFFPGLINQGIDAYYYTTSKSYAPLSRSLGSRIVNKPPSHAMGSHVLLGDLPYIMGIDAITKIPSALPLCPDVNHLKRMRNKLSTLPKPWIGITWRAGMPGINQLAKAIPLEQLLGIFLEFTGTLIILQREPTAQELALISQCGLRCVIHNAANANADLEDSLAVLALLDEYITVNNTNVHLRDGLNLPSKVLIPWPPEWRWGNDITASPWFKNCAIYRENKGKQWNTALALLKNTLAC
ncbi:MAG: tetratricopeptide repeat protein, partial [Pseudomonadota bacterium]